MLVLACARALSLCRRCHCKEAEGGAERSGRKIDVDVVPAWETGVKAAPFASRE